MLMLIGAVAVAVVIPVAFAFAFAVAVIVIVVIVVVVVVCCVVSLGLWATSLFLSRHLHYGRPGATRRALTYLCALRLVCVAFGAARVWGCLCGLPFDGQGMAEAGYANTVGGTLRKISAARMCQSERNWSVDGGCG